MRKLILILVMLFWFGSALAEKMNITKEYEEKLIQRVKKAYGLLPFSSAEVPPRPICMTPVFLEYGLIKDYLSEGARRELSFLNGRPSYDVEEDSFYTPDGHFKIHYTKTGAHRVYRYWEDLNPADGHPDYINRCAEICERVWEIEVDSLGYNPPPSDDFYTPNGGDGKYDIYILSLGSGILGWSTPENRLPSDIKSYTSYVVIRNDFSLYYWPYIEGVEVTLAHEFFHAIQYGYDAREPFTDLYDQNSYNPYWMEMTAVWMEDVVYDEVDDYIGYLHFFFDYPWLSLKTYAHPDSNVIKFMHLYGSCVWPIYLGENYEEDIIKKIWEDCAKVMGSNFWSATANRIGDIQEAFRDFTVWNFFTGDRADTANYYSEGDLWYDGLTPIQIDSIPALYHNSYPVKEDGVPQDYQPQGLASDYIFFEVLSDSAGGLRIEFYGYSGDNWKGSVIGYSNDSILIDTMQIFPMKQDGVIDVINWDEFDHIIFIPARVSGDTLGSDFKYNAYYVDTLTSQPNPPDIVKMFQSSPNPFVIDGRESFVNFPMILKEATYVEVNIFTVAGELVRKVYRGSLPAGDYSRRDTYPGLIPALAWDGKNEQGEEIASGIYLYQIKTKDMEVIKKMAVIRK